LADDAKPIDTAAEQRAAAELNLAAAAGGARSFLQRHRLSLMIGGPAILLAVVAYFVIFGGRYVSTDDSYVRANRVAVSPSISGRIETITVHENEFVKQGQVLLTIERNTYRAQAAQAQADLSKAMQNAAYMTREERRQRELKRIGVSSQGELDKAISDAEQARLQVATLQPRLDVARKNLNDTQVKAAQDGIVTKVDQAQVGAVVNNSQPLFFLVSGRPWVEANFKEDQLKHMRIGQSAEVRIDAFDNVKVKARLKSFSPGTGSSFALLPPENATGNWVKVVQRVPVQFELIDPPADLPLIAGLSAKVTVDIKSPGANERIAEAK